MEHLFCIIMFIWIVHYEPVCQRAAWPVQVEFECEYSGAIWENADVFKENHQQSPSLDCEFHFILGLDYVCG